MRFQHVVPNPMFDEFSSRIQLSFCQFTSQLKPGYWFPNLFTFNRCQRFKLYFGDILMRYKHIYYNIYIYIYTYINMYKPERPIFFAADFAPIPIPHPDRRLR